MKQFGSPFPFSDAQCPLLSELAAIKEGGTDVDCVVIDDARLFFVPHPKLRAATGRAYLRYLAWFRQVGI
jgi:hypothetical protein